MRVRPHIRCGGDIDLQFVRSMHIRILLLEVSCLFALTVRLCFAPLVFEQPLAFEVAACFLLVVQVLIVEFSPARRFFADSYRQFYV